MRGKLSIIYVVFRDIIMLVTFVLALNLERAGRPRLVTMVILFFALFVWLHIRESFKERFSAQLPYFFAADIFLLVMLDETSKFLVNYYFNVYYFYVLIAAGFMLKRKSRLVVSFAIVAAAFVKYLKFIQALFWEPIPENISFVISYIFFTFMVYITIAVFFNYSRMLSEEKAELDRLNNELLIANKLLEEKNEKIRELTIFEERNRIAREIHDSVGHHLTGLVMNLDFCEKLAANKPSMAAEQISKCRMIAKECLSEIRRSVKALKPAAVENHSLMKSLNELAVSSKDKLSVDVVLNIQGDKYVTKPDFDAAVYRACQEGITNSVRHGKSTDIQIDIEYSPKEFLLSVKDNGKGCEKINIGSGLTGMKERFEHFNGIVAFDGSNGFEIRIKVPAEEIKYE